MDTNCTCYMCVSVQVLLSPEYLPAMKKRKSSDAFGDTAGNLGTAMDELMRHQPSLREPAISAIIGVGSQIFLAW